VFPPLGLFYIAAAIKDKHEVLFWDACLDGDEVPDGYDIYGITVNITEVPWVRRFLVEHKPHNPQAQYVLGGPYVSTSPKDIRIDGYDLVILGEGERAISEYLDAGACPDGGALLIPTYPIDEIAFPARRLCGVERYTYFLSRESGGYVGLGSDIPVGARKATSLITSRGCPFRCSFCSRTPWDIRTKFRSVDNILAEIDEIVSLGYTGLMIYDDTFTLNRRRVLGLCQRLEPYDLLWKAFIRADRIDESLAFAMARAGCVEVSIGIESGSQQILDGVGKHTTVEQNTEAVRICQEAGINVRAFMILGLPGETHETIAETRAWLDTARPDSIGLGPLIPYPGSRIWEHPRQFDIQINLPEDEEEWHYRGEPGHYNVYVSTSGLSSEEIANYIYEIEKDWGLIDTSNDTA
jgi:anaerobic magnesium-protoporphyrin IX monomethyl ester cyclase